MAAKDKKTKTVNVTMGQRMMSSGVGAMITSIFGTSNVSRDLRAWDISNWLFDTFASVFGNCPRV